MEVEEKGQEKRISREFHKENFLQCQTIADCRGQIDPELKKQGLGIEEGRFQTGGLKVGNNSDPAPSFIVDCWG